MELINEIYRHPDADREARRFAVATAASLIFPFAPHLGAEVFELLTGERVWEEPWPAAGPGDAGGRHVRARLPGQRQGPRPRAGADRRRARRAGEAGAGRPGRSGSTSTATRSSRWSSCPTSWSTSSSARRGAARDPLRSRTSRSSARGGDPEARTSPTPRTSGAALAQRRRDRRLRRPRRRDGGGVAGRRRRGRHRRRDPARARSRRRQRVGEGRHPDRARRAAQRPDRARRRRGDRGRRRLRDAVGDRARAAGRRLPCLGLRHLGRSTGSSRADSPRRRRSSWRSRTPPRSTRSPCRSSPPI